MSAFRTYTKNAANAPEIVLSFRFPNIKIKTKLYFQECKIAAPQKNARLNETKLKVHYKRCICLDEKKPHREVQNYLFSTKVYIRKQFSIVYISLFFFSSNVN